MIGLLFGHFGPRSEFTLGFAGDIMLNSIAPADKVWSGVQSDVKRPNIFFANLEVSLTDSKTVTTRKSVAELKSRSQFVLKALPDHASLLAAIGIDCVTLANNHSMDYGGPGNRQMRALLDRSHIHYAGAGENAVEAMKIAIVALPDGTKIGLFSALAFLGTAALRKTTPARFDSPGVNVLNFGAQIDAKAKERIGRIVASAHKQCDFLVVGLHWGIESQPLPTSYQVALGRAFVDVGAQVVWGHHPHVLEGAELYKGAPILYSMGNFISPTPATSGIVHMRFHGHKLAKSYFQPVLVKGGRAISLFGAGSAPWRKNFAFLCGKLRTKYPNPNSRPFVP